MSLAIAARDLSFVYPDGTRALDGVALDVADGERVGLVGPAGAGKSTFALNVLGLLQPSDGTLSVYGLAVRRQHLKQIRQCAGYVFQNPDDQLFMPTVLEDVAFGLLSRDEDPIRAAQIARQTLAQVGLEAVAEKFPGHLSGGQKRAAALATVLAMRPRLVILDEPTNSLDPYSRRLCMQQIDRLDRTTVIISHDLEMILELCERAVLLKDGRVVANGGPRALFADRELMLANHLEVPHSLSRSCPLSRDRLPDDGPGRPASKDSPCNFHADSTGSCAPL